MLCEYNVSEIKHKSDMQCMVRKHSLFSLFKLTESVIKILAIACEWLVGTLM